MIQVVVLNYPVHWLHGLPPQTLSHLCHHSTTQRSLSFAISMRHCQWKLILASVKRVNKPKLWRKRTCDKHWKKHSRLSARCSAESVWNELRGAEPSQKM